MTIDFSTIMHPLSAIVGKFIRANLDEVQTWAAMPKGLNEDIVKVMLEYARTSEDIFQLLSEGAGRTITLDANRFINCALLAERDSVNDEDSRRYDQQAVAVWESLSRYVLLLREFMPLGNLLMSGTEGHLPEIEEDLDRPGMAVFAILGGMVYHVSSRQRLHQFGFDRFDRLERALFYTMSESEAHLRFC